MPMEIEEHFYTDDPAIGHADVRTRLTSTDYFFLGNGYIQAAVQVCRSGEGTPVGLLIMHPERFGPKRAALTCDLQSGLEETIVGLRVDGSVMTPDPSGIRAEWDTTQGIPTVRITWQAGPVTVTERFLCPERAEACIARRIEIRAPDPGPRRLALHTGLAEPQERPLEVSADGTTRRNAGL